ncbi:hypothetical protein CDEN61S_03998 [Castellaniella denitrificans]
MALMELAGTETGTRIAEKLGAESFDRLSRWFAELRAEDDVCARAPRSAIWTSSWMRWSLPHWAGGC